MDRAGDAFGVEVGAQAVPVGAAGDVEVEDVVAALRQWQKLPSPARKPAPKPPPLPLGPVPLHPHGPDPDGFSAHPQTTKVDVVKAQLDRGARMALLDARAQSDYLQEHIVEDLWTAYDQRLRGLPTELPPRTTSFKAWAQASSQEG